LDNILLVVSTQQNGMAAMKFVANVCVCLRATVAVMDCTGLWKYSFSVSRNIRRVLNHYAEVYWPFWTNIKEFNRRQQVEGLRACWRRPENSWG